MKNLKKTLSLLMVIVLLFGCFAGTVWAEGSASLPEMDIQISMHTGCLAYGDYENYIKISPKVAYTFAGEDTVSFRDHKNDDIFALDDVDMMTLRLIVPDGFAIPEKAPELVRVAEDDKEKELIGKKQTVAGKFEEVNGIVYLIFPDILFGVTDYSPLAKHQFETTEESAATCTQQGTKKLVCAACGYETIEKTNALGHDWDTENVVTVEPTCTEKGSTTCTCKREECDAKNITEVRALGHDYKVEKEVAPTCTEKGYTTYKCSRCDHTENRNETRMTGHKFVPKSGEESTKHICLNTADGEQCGVEADHVFADENWTYDGNHALFKNGTESNFCVDCHYTKTRVKEHTNTLYKLTHGTFGFCLFVIVAPIVSILQILGVNIDF